MVRPCRVQLCPRRGPEAATPQQQVYLVLDLSFEIPAAAKKPGLLAAPELGQEHKVSLVRKLRKCSKTTVSPRKY